jgi:hypothetical protein
MLYFSLLQLSVASSAIACGFPQNETGEVEELNSQVPTLIALIVHQFQCGWTTWWARPLATSP